MKHDIKGDSPIIKCNAGKIVLDITGKAKTLFIYCEKIMIVQIGQDFPLIELSGLGTTKDASMAFGGKPAQLLAAFKQLQHQLYRMS